MEYESKTVEAHLKGFTIVFDSLLMEYGIITASVYGMVYRYCQMRKGKCTASQSMIAERLGIARRTVNIHLQKLVDEGYLRAETMNNQYVVYYLTDKLELSVVVEPEKGVTNLAGCNLESQACDLGLHKDTSKETIKEQEHPPLAETREPCDEDGIPLSWKEPPKKVKKEKVKPDPPELFSLADALADVTGMSLKANKSRLFAEAKNLQADERVSAELIRMTYSKGGAWWSRDWRGIQGQRPRLHEIRETLFTFDEVDVTPKIKGDIKTR